LGLEIERTPTVRQTKVRIARPSRLCNTSEEQQQQTTRTMLSTLHFARHIVRRTAFPAAIGAVRHLNVHEYISMGIMNEHNITTPKAFVASTPEEAEHIFQSKLNTRKYFVQVVWIYFQG
jgi:hypothetical protein